MSQPLNHLFPISLVKFSHFPIFKFSHFHIFPFSNYQIITLSHLQIFALAFTNCPFGHSGINVVNIYIH